MTIAYGQGGTVRSLQFGQSRHGSQYFCAGTWHFLTFYIQMLYGAGLFTHIYPQKIQEWPSLVGNSTIQVDEASAIRFRFCVIFCSRLDQWGAFRAQRVLCCSCFGIPFRGVNELAGAQHALDALDGMGSSNDWMIWMVELTTQNADFTAKKRTSHDL